VKVRLTPDAVDPVIMLGETPIPGLTRDIVVVEDDENDDGTMAAVVQPHG